MIDQSAAKCRTGTGYQKIAICDDFDCDDDGGDARYTVYANCSTDIPIYHDRP
jgi:hypothetical protein